MPQSLVIVDWEHVRTQHLPRLDVGNYLTVERGYRLTENKALPHRLKAALQFSYPSGVIHEGTPRQLTAGFIAQRVDLRRVLDPLGGSLDQFIVCAGDAFVEPGCRQGIAAVGLHCNG